MLGYGLMEILASLQFPIAGEDQRIPLDRGFRQYAIAAAASLTAGAVAAWLPARKTSRVDPVDILGGAVCACWTPATSAVPCRESRRCFLWRTRTSSSNGAASRRSSVPRAAASLRCPLRSARSEEH